MGRNKLVGIRQCANCGKDVEIYHRKRMEYENVYCCKECECAYKKKRREADQNYFNVRCVICGKPMHLKPCRANKYKEHSCSPECEKEYRRRIMSGENNHQYGLRGDKNASWKSDRRISSYGYVLIRCPEHPFANIDGFVFEHRLVAEQYLLTEDNSVDINGKRYLDPELVIHHIDHNRQNNLPENLRIMTRGEHSRLHEKHLI